MDLDLFAGIAVTDHDAAVPWYEQLLGEPCSFRAHDRESVWILAEHRALYVVQHPGRAGHGLVTLMVEELDPFLAAAGARGVVPTEVEDYGNGVRKALFHDPDGNEVGVGEAPAQL
jgi:predicted enzyme related to lactoylglutathione lyase